MKYFLISRQMPIVVLVDTCLDNFFYVKTDLRPVQLLYWGQQFLWVGRRSAAHTLRIILFQSTTVFIFVSSSCVQKSILVNSLISSNYNPGNKLMAKRQKLRESSIS